MSRKQQHATLVHEVRSKVELTPIRDDSLNLSDNSPPLRGGVPDSESINSNVAVTLKSSLASASISNQSTLSTAQGTPKQPSSPHRNILSSVDASDGSSLVFAQSGKRVVPLPSLTTADASHVAKTAQVTDEAPTSSSLHPNLSAAPETPPPSQRSHLAGVTQHRSSPSLLNLPQVVLSAHTHKGTSHTEHDHLTAMLEKETKRRLELEEIIRELSDAVHRQAKELESERATIRALREELKIEQSRGTSKTAKHPAETVRSRTGSVPVVSARSTSRPSTPIARPPSPARVPARMERTNTQSSAASSSGMGPTQTSRASSADARRSSPSIMRPTVSSVRRSSPTLDTASRASSTEKRRAISPVVARQQLATATFLRATVASSAASGQATSGAQPARPKLSAVPGSAANHVEPSQPRRTVVLTKNGVVVPQSPDSGAPRKLTPARERIEAAIAKMVAPQIHRR